MRLLCCVSALAASLLALASASDVPGCPIGYRCEIHNNLVIPIPCAYQPFPNRSACQETFNPGAELLVHKSVIDLVPPPSSAPDAAAAAADGAADFVSFSKPPRDGVIRGDHVYLCGEAKDKDKSSFGILSHYLRDESQQYRLVEQWRTDLPAIAVTLDGKDVVYVATPAALYGVLDGQLRSVTSENYDTACPGEGVSVTALGAWESSPLWGCSDGSIYSSWGRMAKGSNDYTEGGHKGAVRVIRSGGGLIVTGGDDRIPRIWHAQGAALDIPTGLIPYCGHLCPGGPGWCHGTPLRCYSELSYLHQQPHSAIRSIALQPADDYLLIAAGTEDGAVFVYKYGPLSSREAGIHVHSVFGALESGRGIVESDLWHMGAVTGVVWSSDIGVVSGSADSYLHLWDTSNGELISEMQVADRYTRHSQPITFISQNGLEMLVGSGDGRVYLMSRCHATEYCDHKGSCQPCAKLNPDEGRFCYRTMLMRCPSDLLVRRDRAGCVARPGRLGLFEMIDQLPVHQTQAWRDSPCPLGWICRDGLAVEMCEVAEKEDADKAQRYADSNATACAECSDGYFVQTQPAERLEADGSTTNIVVGVSCHLCDAGSYCRKGRRFPCNTTNNEFTAEAGMSEPSICCIEHAVFSNASACVYCGEGQVIQKGADTVPFCTPCANLTGNSYCEKFDFHGTTIATVRLCNEGSFIPDESRTACVACNASQYCPGGLARPTTRYTVTLDFDGEAVSSAGLTLFLVLLSCAIILALAVVLLWASPLRIRLDSSKYRMPRRGRKP